MGASASSPAAPLSVPVYEGAHSDSESAVYRNALSPQQLVTSVDGTSTLYENFQLGCSINPSGPCLGEREGAGGNGPFGPYAWLTYRDVETRARGIGSALVSRGFRRGTPIGLYSRNCAAWVLVEQACNAYTLVTVPLYDTLGAEAVEYVVSFTRMPVVACTRDKVDIVLDVARTNPSLQLVLEMDPLPSTPATRSVGGVTVCRLDAFTSEGLRDTQPVDPPRANDIATIVFTSGTTATPKGALLTHGNFASATAAAASCGVDLTAADVHISYLPLAHVFERIVQVCVYHRGAAVGFFNGDVQRLLEDMAELKPTLFPSVPRLYNRVHDKIMAGLAVAPATSRALFEFAMASKLYYLRNGGATTHALYDRLVFAKLRALLGGRVRLMITGSAPLAQSVKEFFQVAFSCPMFEGYGLTETTGIATLTMPTARAVPGVGSVTPCCELKLVDIPEMGYRHTDKPNPRGEICLRGNNIFVGYYRSPEQTAEAIDAEGWFHTGDVGQITADGIVSLIDRKKNIFKLAQGEYVAPEKIEGVYGRSAFVAQIFVHGDSLKSSLLAIVVPDAEVAQRWATERQLSGDAANLSTVVAMPMFKDAVLASMREAAAAAGLKGFECVKAIHLEASPFAVDNGLLTPTFKLKRQELKRRYQPEIDAMYASIGE